MILKQLINKSVYGTIGYVGDEIDLHNLQMCLEFNLPVLKQYKQIVVATNFSSQSNLVEQYNKIWKTYFPDCVLLNSPNNRGPAFGTADLDNKIFNYCKNHKIKWLCKSANDVIFRESILDLQIDKADFYYLNGIGWGGLKHYDFDFSKILEEYFYPQTNFYFIDISKTDYLNNEEYLNDTYNYVSSLSNYRGKPWEHFPGWSCEDFLKECVSRNELLTHHLISRDSYIKLMLHVLHYYVDDPSHKNIMIKGIAHVGVPSNPIIEIN